MFQVLSYRDWYRSGPLATVPQADRSIPGGPVQMSNVSPPAGAVVEAPVPEYALHLLIRTAPLLRVGFNRRPRWLAVSPGAMLLAPPDTSCEYVSDEAAHVLTFAIAKNHVEDFTQHCGGRVEVRREEAFRDPRLVHQLVRLWHELADDAPASRLFADHVMRSVLETIAERSGSYAPPRHGRERLPPHTLRRLRDYVESSLGDDLDVTMMAEVAQLSPAHFARAFAATVAMTPFRYVMTRRLSRARELLERTQRSALDIALDVGFKTASHFASRFRREFGVTPRAIRSDARRSDAVLWRQLRLTSANSSTTSGMHDSLSAP
jgi:AraC family transcriptional regulator